ncbi:hypothetical protein ABK040_004877 [Willaertia magna]
MLKAKINEECFEMYNDLKMSKGCLVDKPFLVMKMENNVIAIDSELTNFNSFEELCQNLPENHARFIFYHLEFEMPKSDNQLCNEGKRSKMMLITWIPGKTNVKEKFQTAGTCHFLKQSFQGIFLSIQACALDEIGRKELISKCLTFMK